MSSGGGSGGSGGGGGGVSNWLKNVGGRGATVSTAIASGPAATLIAPITTAAAAPAAAASAATVAAVPAATVAAVPAAGTRATYDKSMLYLNNGQAQQTFQARVSGNPSVQFSGPGTTFLNQQGLITGYTVNNQPLTAQQQQDQQQLQQQLVVETWQPGKRMGKIRAYFTGPGNWVATTTDGKVLTFSAPNARTKPVSKTQLLTMQKVQVAAAFNGYETIDVPPESSSYTFIIDSLLRDAVQQEKTNAAIVAPTLAAPPVDFSLTAPSPDGMKKALSHVHRGSFTDLLKVINDDYKISFDRSGQKDSRYSITAIEVTGRIKVEQFNGATFERVPTKLCLQTGDKYGSPCIVREMLTANYVNSFSDTSAPLNPNSMISEQVRDETEQLVHFSYPNIYLRGIVGEFGPMFTVLWPQPTFVNPATNTQQVRITFDMSIALELVGSWPQTQKMIQGVVVTSKGVRRPGGFQYVPNTNETVWDGISRTNEAAQDATSSTMVKLAFGAAGGPRLTTPTGVNVSGKNTLLQTAASAKTVGGEEDMSVVLKSVGNAIVKAQKDASSEIRKAMEKQGKSSRDEAKKMAKKEKASKVKKSGGKITVSTVAIPGQQTASGQQGTGSLSISVHRDKSSSGGKKKKSKKDKTKRDKKKEKKAKKSSGGKTKKSGKK